MLQPNSPHTALFDCISEFPTAAPSASLP